MPAAVQVVHRLYGEQHGELVAGLLLGHGKAQLELAAARDLGWIPASLGATTLRFETAIIAGAAIIRAAQHGRL